MPGEGMLSRDQLVSDDAPRVDVRALVCRRIGGGLLGRHVHRRADIVARLGYFRRRFLPRRLYRLGDSEIGDDRGALTEQNVLGLDVAMPDSLPVAVGEGGRDLAQDGPAVC